MHWPIELRLLLLIPAFRRWYERDLFDWTETLVKQRDACRLSGNYRKARRLHLWAIVVAMRLARVREAG